MVLTAPTSTVYDPNSDLSTRNNPRSKVKQVVKQRTGSIQPLFDLINDITLYLCLLAATVNGIASVASISFLLLFGVVVLFVTTSNCITSMDGSDMHITPSGALSTPSEYYSKTDTLINRIASSIFLVPTASSSTVYHSQAQQAMLAAIDTIRVVSFGSYYNEKKLDNSADIHIWYHKAFASDGRNIWLTPIQPTFTATDIIRGWVCTRITTTSNHIMSMDSSDRHFTPSGALSTSSEYYFEPDILINQSSIFLLPTASTSTVYHSQTQQAMLAAIDTIRVVSFGSYYNEKKLDNSADIHIWYHKAFASDGRNIWLTPIQPTLTTTDIIRGWVCTRITTTSNHIMSMDSSDRHFTPSGALSTSSEYLFEPDILINQSSIFLLPTASTSTVYHSQTQQPMFAATAIIRVASFGSYYNEDRLDNSADIHIWYHKTFASHGRNVWLSPIQPMLAATDIIHGWVCIRITTTSNRITSTDGGDRHITPSGALSITSECLFEPDSVINRIASLIVSHYQTEQPMLAATDIIHGWV
eukprot:1108344_1